MCLCLLLRVRLLVTDLAAHMWQRDRGEERGGCVRGTDLQLACLLVDDLIKSLWRLAAHCCCFCCFSAIDSDSDSD